MALAIKYQKKATFIESMDNYFDSRPTISGMVFLSALVSLIVFLYVIGGQYGYL